MSELSSAWFAFLVHHITVSQSLLLQCSWSHLPQLHRVSFSLCKPCTVWSVLQQADPVVRHAHPPSATLLYSYLYVIMVILVHQITVQREAAVVCVVTMAICKICAATQHRIHQLKHWISVGVCCCPAPMSQHQVLTEIFGFHKSFPKLYCNQEKLLPTDISHQAHTRTQTKPCNVTDDRLMFQHNLTA